MQSANEKTKYKQQLYILGMNKVATYDERSKSLFEP